MLTVELGKIIKAEKIFLVSSARTTSDLPRIGRIPNINKLLKIIPERMFGNPNSMSLRIAGATNDDDRKILSDMMNDTPKGFMKWSLNAVLTWNNTIYPSNVIQLHGTKDLLIPPANIHPDYWIEGGTHIMVYNRASEVSKIISDCLTA